MSLLANLAFRARTSPRSRRGRQRLASKAEVGSTALMQDLLDRTIRDAIVYRHRWRPGDMVVCDNRATMHRAHGDYDRRHPRMLWRIILEGDRPA